MSHLVPIIDMTLSLSLSLSRPLVVLSLGAGVQSSALALMAAKGELPMPDLAIFADTGHEPRFSRVQRPDGTWIEGGVYGWLNYLESQIPFPICRVTAGDLAVDSLRVKRSRLSGKLYSRNLIPAFVDKGDGKKGLLGRKCTADYKITPIQRLQREMVKALMPAWRKKHKGALTIWNAYQKALVIAKKTKTPVPAYPREAWDEMQSNPLVIQWIGISTDEAQRMKPSRVPYIRSVWPLIDAGISRKQCIQWMVAKGFPIAPRSACTFCPFHGDEEWIRLRDESPDDFAAAVQFEKDLQESCTKQEVLKGVPYLHDSCKPLDQVVFKSLPSHQQLNHFGNECEGLCGV